jgi:hypothetical protein
LLEFDPVLFTNDQNNYIQETATRANSNPNVKVDRISLPGSNNNYNSSYHNSANNSGRRNNNNIFSSNEGETTYLPPSGRTGGRNSGRADKTTAVHTAEALLSNRIARSGNRPSVETGYLIPASAMTQRKAVTERQKEIDLVRSLQ